jgi:hypothetical protein
MIGERLATILPALPKWERTGTEIATGRQVNPAGPAFQDRPSLPWAPVWPAAGSPATGFGSFARSLVVAVARSSSFASAYSLSGNGLASSYDDLMASPSFA